MVLRHCTINFFVHPEIILQARLWKIWSIHVHVRVLYRILSDEKEVGGRGCVNLLDKKSKRFKGLVI